METICNVSFHFNTREKKTKLKFGIESEKTCLQQRRNTTEKEFIGKPGLWKRNFCSFECGAANKCPWRSIILPLHVFWAESCKQNQQISGKNFNSNGIQRCELITFFLEYSKMTKFGMWKNSKTIWNDAWSKINNLDFHNIYLVEKMNSEMLRFNKNHSTWWCAWVKVWHWARF